MTEEKKAPEFREFWVSYEGLSKRVASEYPVDWSETNDCIHVVEKRALTEALQKLEAAELRNEKTE